MSPKVIPKTDEIRHAKKAILKVTPMALKIASSVKHSLNQHNTLSMPCCLPFLFRLVVCTCVREEKRLAVFFYAEFCNKCLYFF